MVERFLPGMRHLVAVKLRSRGLSQNRVSALLGVTQASVSVYLATDPDRAYNALAKLSMSRSQADRDSVELADAVQKGAVQGVRALERIWTDLLGSGGVCQAHREMYPSLSNCDYCIAEYGGRGEVAQTIGEVARAAEMLEGSEYFVNIMPEVSVNLACVAGDAKSPSEVVAIPGRIVRVKNRAKAMLPPEPGASVHMARMLLLARSRMPEVRACINLRYDLKMDALLSRAGLRILELGSHPSREAEDATVAALENRLGSSTSPFDAIVDKGGSGIEPNVYLFARGARDAARLAIRIARAYSTA